MKLFTLLLVALSFSASAAFANEVGTKLSISEGTEFPEVKGGHWEITKVQLISGGRVFLNIQAKAGLLNFSSPKLNKIEVGGRIPARNIHTVSQLTVIDGKPKSERFNIVSLTTHDEYKVGVSTFVGEGAKKPPAFEGYGWTFQQTHKRSDLRTGITEVTIFLLEKTDSTKPDIHKVKRFVTGIRSKGVDPTRNQINQALRAQGKESLKTFRNNSSAGKSPTNGPPVTIFNTRNSNGGRRGHHPAITTAAVHPKKSKPRKQ